MMVLCAVFFFFFTKFRFSSSSSYYISDWTIVVDHPTNSLTYVHCHSSASMAKNIQVSLDFRQLILVVVVKSSK